MAAVVIGAVSSGAWFYITAAESLLDGNDRRHALCSAQSFSRLVADHITNGRIEDINKVADDFREAPEVAYVAVVGADGELLARSCRDGRGAMWDGQLLNLPASMSSTRRYGNMLALAQPIVVDGPEGSSERLVGSVRLVLDVSATAISLAAARQRLWTIAAAVTLCAIPLGYLLVWRVVVQPIRRLVAVARWLAAGDFSARARMDRNDEMGELADAFDTMAGQIADARAELLAANKLLEQKVADRTQRLASANARLEQEIADKDALQRTVSHDLSAPLRNIAGLASMMLLKWRDELPEDLAQRLERIQANAEAEIAMISDLLEVSRIRTSRRECRMVDVGELLSDLASKFEFELQARDIALEIEQPQPVLCIEPNRIRQVFQNLIDNAIKYMDKPRGGKITVRYSLDEPYHEFRVSDNGPGVPVAQQREVFRIFRRAQAPGSSEVPGKGIGLAVVSAVAGGYGGKAWVQPSADGGASFCFTLAVDQTAQPTDQQARSVHRHGPSGKYRAPNADRQEHAAGSRQDVPRISDITDHGRR